MSSKLLFWVLPAGDDLLSSQARPFGDGLVGLQQPCSWQASRSCDLWPEFLDAGRIHSLRESQRGTVLRIPRRRNAARTRQQVLGFSQEKTDGTRDPI